MNSLICFLNKKCREESSKELVDNLRNEQDAIEKLYSAIISNKSENTHPQTQ